VQHLRDFGRFEMNKRNLGRQREDRILVAEEEILHEIENQPQTSSRRLANHVRVSQFIVWMKIQLLSRMPPPPGGTAILPEYIHYYG
jgi:hypothetical protein